MMLGYEMLEGFPFGGLMLPLLFNSLDCDKPII